VINLFAPPSHVKVSDRGSAQWLPLFPKEPFVSGCTGYKNLLIVFRAPRGLPAPRIGHIPWSRTLPQPPLWGGERQEVTLHRGRKRRNHPHALSPACVHTAFLGSHSRLSWHVEIPGFHPLILTPKAEERDNLCPLTMKNSVFKPEIYFIFPEPFLLSCRHASRPGFWQRSWTHLHQFLFQHDALCTLRSAPVAPSSIFFPMTNPFLRIAPASGAKDYCFFFLFRLTSHGRSASAPCRIRNPHGSARAHIRPSI